MFERDDDVIDLTQNIKNNRYNANRTVSPKDRNSFSKTINNS